MTNNEHRVGDQYRSNELSVIPGGTTVRVKYTNGKVRVYDKIKDPQKYVSRIVGRTDVVEIWVEDTKVFSRA